jgi:hypothetical protein
MSKIVAMTAWQAVDVFSEADKRDIRDCARGIAGSKEKAIAVHRASMRVHGMRSGDPYFDFMSEVDNPCPDLMLRARLRAKILADGE